MPVDPTQVQIARPPAASTSRSAYRHLPAFSVPPTSPQPLLVRGGTRLRGEVAISGYKHALTTIVAAAVARAGAVSLENVPIVTESRVLERILRDMGATSRLADGVWDIDTGPLRPDPIPAHLGSVIHGSLYLAPALLARFGTVSFAGAGGDRIGPPELAGHRPIAQVGAVMERFGAAVDTACGLHATAESLRGCTLDLMEFSSHRDRLRGPAASSATKTALILASVARGETRLHHPVDTEATRELCDYLRACGVCVAQEGETWRILAGGTAAPVTHTLVSDGMEMVTLIACSAHARVSFRLTGIKGERSWAAVEDELRVFEAIGTPMRRGEDWLEVDPPTRIDPISLDVECNGFSTDAHPLLALVLLGAAGESRITDHVWTSRFAYARLLVQMGAELQVEGNTISLRPSALRAPAMPLRPTDSRAAAVAVVGALGARGTTRIEDAGHLERSYDRLLDKLGAGAEPGLRRRS
jgi:UDP-N-acetylglucosamine 1-carboxyvinyltransferase